MEEAQRGLSVSAARCRSRSAPKRRAGTPSYYGLSIQARRIVFVIDISGSMRGPRLEAAQRELMQAIDKLPEKTSLSIVAFSDRTTIWRKTLMPATPQTKQTAKNFVYLLRAGGRTAAYDALEAAFRFDAEAIYFLSDGEPNAGKIPRPDAILKAVSQAQPYPAHLDLHDRHRPRRRRRPARLVYENACRGGFRRLSAG